MEYLPEDSAVLTSGANILLCDEEFDSLGSSCYNFNEDIEKLKTNLCEAGYIYSEEQHQLRPIGFDE